MKKMNLNGKISDVVEMEEYARHPSLYNPKYVGIDCGDMVLPLKSKTTDSGPGVYYKPGSIAARVVKPSPEEAEKYSKENVIDYDSAEDIGKILENNRLIRNIRKDQVVTDPDNVFNLPIGPNNTPEMKALKQAINAKRADRDDYEGRFDNYQNDMRLLKGDRITIKKMQSIAEIFDLNITLIISDKDENVPNPMGNQIVVDLGEG